MTEQTPLRLAGELREAAEAFFRADLSGIELHHGDLPREFGAAACAWGSRIWLPSRSSLTSLDERELLGHELAHVVQQRQGRVPKTLTLAGCAANDDPALEREAVEAGRRFARGGVTNLPSLPLSASHRAVIQRAVTVGDQQLGSQSDLTTVGGALQLIDGAEWLAWAIGNSTVHYRYADEESLLVGMQSGLHGSDLLLLRTLGIQLHPFKLLEMEPEDLSVLTAAETETGANSVTEMQARKVLAKYHLLSQSDLAIGTDFLTQAEVAAAPVFQGMALADRLALFNLVDGASSELSLNQMIQKEAAAFAVQHAQNIAEFVDYYQFYIAEVNEAAPAPKGAAARARKAETQLELIVPLLFGKLFCPAVQGVPAPEQLNVILQNWLASGKGLAFARLSQALAQVAQHASLKGASGETATRIIESYMEQARQFILQRPAGSVELTQDGLDRYYIYDNKQAQAEVCLAWNGNVTLATYQPNQARK